MIDISHFGEIHLRFIEDEFGLSRKELEAFSKDAWHELRMKCFDIECSGIDEEGECSDRGEIAADIASMLYADIRKKN